MNIPRRPFEGGALYGREQQERATQLFEQLKEIALLAQELSRDGAYIQEVYRHAPTEIGDKSVNILGKEAVHTLTRWRDLRMQAISLLAQEMLTSPRRSRATVTSPETWQHLSKPGWLRAWLERYAVGVTLEDSLLIKNEVDLIERTFLEMSQRR